MVSRELQETLVHQDVWVFLDLRVLLEVLAHRVSLGHRDLPDNWEQLDSQVKLDLLGCPESEENPDLLVLKDKLVRSDSRVREV